MHALHQQAEDRYHRLRRLALESAQANLPNHASYQNIRLKIFDTTTWSAFKKWKNSPERSVDWDWMNHYSAFKFRHPKRFEMAVWDKQELAGLSLGRPTYQGTALRLDVIEGSPYNSEDLKVFLVGLIALTTYAEALGANEIRIMKPINEDVKQYYARYGLTYVANGDYMYTRV